MIFATAGHVDHGKTSLIKALTGISTAHLPEEKKRGMTIDLGYAYWSQPDGSRIGFVDVPGHEKFLSNMLAGIGGIKHVLLVVACDDGVMAQTREHLAILRLAGRPEVTVVLTKADRVTPERIEDVKTQIANELVEQGWQDFQLFVTSTQTEEGIEPLREYLCQLHHQAQFDCRHEKRFRLAIDRVFTVKGAGIVVTGTALTGQVNIGDTLWLTGANTTVRVRGLHAQNQTTESASAGSRIALNISGSIDKVQISRGDWLLSQQPESISEKVLVVLENDEPLKNWQPVHIHHGASHITGRISLLTQPTDKPILAELILDTPLWLAESDNLILRDISAKRTVAGARVLQLHSPRRGKRRPEFIEWLTELSQVTSFQTDALHSEPLQLKNDKQILALNLPRGELSLPAFAWARQLTDEQLNHLIADFDLVIADDIALSRHLAQVAETKLLETLSQYHVAHPDQFGVGRDRLKRMALPAYNDALVHILISELIATQQIVQTRGWLHLSSHQFSFDEVQSQLWAKISGLFKQESLWVRDLAKITHEDEATMRSLLKKAAQLGYVMAIVPDRYYSREQIQVFADFIREKCTCETHIHEMNAKEDGIGAAQFRDQFSIGRKLSVQILEFFDKTGFTRRRFDRHILRDKELF